MTSVSLPTPIQFHQGLHHPPSPSQNLSAHSRRKSRNVATPLPSFVFNPSLSEQQPHPEAQPSEDEAVSTKPTRRASKPPALPDFKFNPGAELPTDDRPSPTHPVLEEMALNQQRIARSARPAPLPAFTFTPGTSSQVTPSPTRTDFNDSYLGRPNGGHKRAGSEFVGGGGTDGATLVSTSPQKHEARPSGPHMLSAGRRGHIHRRSQAVSISDIDTSDLIKIHAIARARTESEPCTGTTTPSETPSVPWFPGQESAYTPPLHSTPSSPHRRETTSGSRPRVEFADKIDVIPRPLSMISSETEGSCSTVRYSHSLTNSVNSVASPTARTSFGATVCEDSAISRPKTADFSALLSTGTSAGHDKGKMSLPARPLSASGTPTPSSPSTQPTKRKHFWSTQSSESTPTSTPKAEQPDPFQSLPEFAPSRSSPLTRPKTSPERSLSFRKRKYHTWTTGIFHKKSKHRMSNSKPRRKPLNADFAAPKSDSVNEIFDADDTIVLRSDSPELKRTQPRLDTNITPVAVKSFQDVQEVTSPVLDIDAALDPFSSDQHPAQENSNRSAASRIAKLHSSERRGIVDAFGVIHRRTESAPSMPAFNRSNLVISRHGSNPSLVEDVFDEQEEDNFLANQRRAQKSFDSQLSTAKRDRPTAAPQRTQHEGLGLSHISRASDSVVIVDSEDDIGASDENSSRSTVDAPIFLEADLTKRPMSSPMSFAYPSTQSHYASSTEGRTTTTASLISSPDADQVHFDTSLLTPTVSQHSPDLYLRPSNDDLPSLSDSISSGAMPRVSSSANTRSSIDHPYEQRYEQRSASMFVPGTSRSMQPSWKRSSLASLNRLIPGSANGSKLRFETTPDSPSEDKTKKRTKRLSKLVTFWRSKEKIAG